MIRRSSGGLCMLLLMSFVLFSGCHAGLKPPMAERIKKELIVPNDRREDFYYWLNERNNPKVLQYLKDENAYTDTVLKETRPLQEKLFKEITSRIKQQDATVPYFDNGYYYYTQYQQGKEYPIYCRRKDSLKGKEEIILDVNELAKGKRFCNVATFNVSPNNKILAFGLDTLSRRKYIIYFKDIESGKLIDIPLQETIGQVAWANDNKTVFYTLIDDTTLRAYKVCRHTLGTPAASDKTMYQEKDETFNCGAYSSKSRKFIFIACLSYVADEYLFLDASKPDGDFKVFQPRKKDLEYSIEHLADKFYIRTNWNAENYSLMETPVNKTSMENWKMILPPRKNVLIEDFELFNNYIVIDERKDGLTFLRVMNLKTNEEHYINFGEEAYTANLSKNLSFDTELLRFDYSSLTTPNSVFTYNMKTKVKTLMKREEVVGDFDPSNYESKRLWAIAPDSTKVPISLVYKKGTKLNGQNPLLLYGYGAYGNSMEPDFNAVRLSLLNRGFIYAIAHIRGGEEMGRQWYEDGKLLRKKNTFTDFIACADYLVANKYTNSSCMFAMGASAGGLLMGAVVNMRPELFKGIIAGVPFVDIVTTMLDENIPLTTGEYDEWGNPKEKEFYNYMLSYSPYDNIKPVKYPAMLILGSLHDSQVQYWEPAKWVAKLRYTKKDHNILLLKTNLEAGHGGSSGRFQKYKDSALEYAFLLNLLGQDK
jgi:oligopeptidase B